ncbi:MAG: serine/threonine protein kinase, partial [Acidobacteriota bacterium]|nr:serine/threonine protein kinase [Acidobacteriota bacterium]
MTPERWQQIREVFGSAIERAPGERASFVKEVCAGDEDLRREVESLLASYERDGSFLEQPAFRVADEIEAADREVLSAGQSISHYEVISLIGEGGMGEVYLARDERLGRRVALKLLPARFTTDRERLRRFEREAQAASKLSHPNVCTIHEVGETDEGRHYIVIEYVEGVTLRERIAGGRLLHVNGVLDIGVQIATALAAAHEAGIIHRDIKPENVIIKRDGLVKVLDFGLAKLTEHQQGVDLEAATRAQVKTRTGLVMGTPRYMSPEQARGFAVDARTDIWSLGVVLYEMVTGRVPFEGETTSHVIISVL